MEKKTILRHKVTGKCGIDLAGTREMCKISKISRDIFKFAELSQTDKKLLPICHMGPQRFGSILFTNCSVHE